MEIALLGGTGNIGEGLALRWARDTDHSIVIGSRDPEKAEHNAESYRDELADRGYGSEIVGVGNEAAAERASVVVVSVPPQYAPDTAKSVVDSLTADKVVVSPAVSMDRDAAGFHYDPPEAGTVAQAIAAEVPESVPVVGAFQNVAAGALTDLDNDLDVDVVVTGDDSDSKALIRSLAEDIDGVRALDGGPLAVTGVVESMTPLLINLAMNNDGMHDLGVRFQ